MPLPPASCCCHIVRVIARRYKLALFPLLLKVHHGTTSLHESKEPQPLSVASRSSPSEFCLQPHCATGTEGLCIAPPSVWISFPSSSSALLTSGLSFSISSQTLGHLGISWTFSPVVCYPLSSILVHFFASVSNDLHMYSLTC
jgi:hypothetical protein